MVRPQAIAACGLVRSSSRDAGIPEAVVSKCPGGKSERNPGLGFRLLSRIPVLQLNCYPAPTFWALNNHSLWRSGSRFRDFAGRVPNFRGIEIKLGAAMGARSWLHGSLLALMTSAGELDGI